MKEMTKFTALVKRWRPTSGGTIFIFPFYPLKTIRFFANVVDRPNLADVCLAMMNGLARAHNDAYYRDQLKRGHLTVYIEKWAEMGRLDKSKTLFSEEDRKKMMPWVNTLSDVQYLQFEVGFSTKKI
jgi:hypothetical protein